jgi:hypothetical protein
VLFIHEVHKVVGKWAAEFEAAYRGGWMPKLAEGTDARLLWYLDLAHGSGLAYRAVTVTAVADGAAWQRLAERVSSGDLQTWARHLDGLQHECTSRIMAPLEWSPAIELADVPTDPAEHEPAMYMEDTMWPFPGRIGDYIEAAGGVYRRSLGSEEAQVGLRIELAYQTVPGAGRYPEVTLMQRIPTLPPLIHLLTHDIPRHLTEPGSWMHDALDLRDQWQSRLLRSAAWSPLP